MYYFIFVLYQGQKIMSIQNNTFINNMDDLLNIDETIINFILIISIVIIYFIFSFTENNPNIKLLYSVLIILYLLIVISFTEIV
jgi:hypothetical protein